MKVKEKKFVVSPVKCLVGMAVLFLLLMSVKRDMQTSETSFGDVWKQAVGQELADAITGRLVPIMTFARQGNYKSSWLVEGQIADVMPLYGYSRQLQEQDFFVEAKEENYLSMEEILGEEAVDEALEDTQEAQITDQSVQQTTEPSTDVEGDNLQELLRAENEAAANGMLTEEVQNAEVVQSSVFVPHTRQNTVDLQQLGSYENLVSMFYTIDGNTMAGSEQLDVTKLLGKDMTISKEGDAPQILIYHTHSQEGFADSVPGDVNTSIVGVGAQLSKILQEKYGYQVLHHTGQYDVEVRDDAYSNSLPAIEQVLAENPSIEVIIDLHRDSMPEETKLVMDLDGRPTARFMFFNGLSRTKNTGDIAYLYNENQEDNLAFSFQMQLKAMEYYPGLTRKIYLKGYRYNMHLRPRTTLIELGAQNNTVEEAMNACEPLAHIIDMVLSGNS